MEREATGNSGADQHAPPPLSGQGGFVISDEAMQELKRQAPGGCVLCELEHLDEEDWD